MFSHLFVDESNESPVISQSDFKKSSTKISTPFITSSYVRPEDIKYEDKKYEFINWAREKFVFKEKRKGLAFFDVDEAVKATNYSKAPIKSPLHLIEDDAGKNIALEAFTCKF